MRKYLLPIILVCIWSCETDPEPEDCSGMEGGTAYVDSCGTCDDDPSNDCVLDCSGEWGGSNVCGCTDNTATNYDLTATFDDGSCIADEVPPSVAITSPTGGSQVSEVTSIQFTANDNVGIEKTEIYTSSGIVATVNGTNDVVYSTNWNTNTLDNQDVNLYAIAYDLSGNITTSEIVTISIYNTVTVTLTNQCHLSMIYQIGQDEPEYEDAIAPQTDGQWEFPKGYGTVTFQGIIGSDCGLTLGWDFDIEVGNNDINDNLFTDGSLFFINLRNSSVYTLNDFYVNYELTSEIGCALDMPNNSVWYPIGYFNAWSNSNVRFESDETSTSWYIDPISLTFENNQVYDVDFNVDSNSIIGGGTNEVIENGILPTKIVEYEADFSIFND